MIKHPSHHLARRSMSFANRRKKLRELIRESKADGLLVTNFINVTYLTGFTGDDSYLLVTLDGETLDHRPALHDAARRRMPWPGRSKFASPA